MKHKHRDCEWLLKKGNKYFCCDSRGKMFGITLTKKDLDTESCEYFHVKKTKEKEKKYE